MDRDALFKSMGFKLEFGEIEGFFDIGTFDIEFDNSVYIDWNNRRILIDSGDYSEPTLLKGEFTKEEKQVLKKYNENAEKEICEYADNLSK